MRLVLAFFIGLVSFFYFGEILNRSFRRSSHGILGIVIIFAGFFVGFAGKGFIPSPIDSLLSLFLLGAGIGLSTHHFLSKRYLISERREKEFMKKHESTLERFLEILPGA